MPARMPVAFVVLFSVLVRVWSGSVTVQLERDISPALGHILVVNLIVGFSKCSSRSLLGILISKGKVSSSVAPNSNDTHGEPKTGDPASDLLDLAFSRHLQLDFLAVDLFFALSKRFDFDVATVRTCGGTVSPPSANGPSRPTT